MNTYENSMQSARNADALVDAYNAYYDEMERQIIRRAREAQALGNWQAVRECRAQLVALTGKGR